MFQLNISSKPYDASIASLNLTLGDHKISSQVHSDYEVISRYYVRIGVTYWWLWASGFLFCPSGLPCYAMIYCIEIISPASLLSVKLMSRSRRPAFVVVVRCECVKRVF